MFGVYHRGRTVVNVKTDKIKRILQGLFLQGQDIFYKKERSHLFSSQKQMALRKGKRRIQDLRTWRIPTMIKMAPAKEASVSGSWRKSTPENVEQTVVMVPKEEKVATGMFPAA